MALSEIRGGSINSLNEASLQAQQCKLKYPILRDQVLEDAPWQFAHRIKPLTLTTIDTFNWAYTYQYPADCLRINRLILNIEEVQQGQGDTVSRRILEAYPRPSLQRQVPYEILNDDGNLLVVANDTDLRVDYIVSVEDPNLFSNQFKIALSYLLASALAVPIVGADVGRALRADSLKLYQAYINAATASDLNQQFTPVEDSEYIQVRS